jgi:hypothetical protein
MQRWTEEACASKIPLCAISCSQIKIYAGLQHMGNTHAQ